MSSGVTLGTPTASTIDTIVTIIAGESIGTTGGAWITIATIACRLATSSCMHRATW